jgi:hypothetical protein
VGDVIWYSPTTNRFYALPSDLHNKPSKDSQPACGIFHASLLYQLQTKIEFDIIYFQKMAMAETL